MSRGCERKVVVVGAGVAGLAAADALVESGEVAVTVIERRGFPGGRAYSYPHPALNEVVDSQHVVVGCCTNLIELCERAGLGDRIRWYDRQTFLEAAGEGREVRASEIASGPLPAPMHYAGSFGRASMLSWADKLSIARGLQELVRGYPAADEESVAQWYRRTLQSAGAIRNFWDPVLIATLNDGAENCSFRYAGKVFHELFLKSRNGGRLGIPTVPLSEFYGVLANRVEERGGTVRWRTASDRIRQRAEGGWTVQTGVGEIFADDLILALPFEATRTLVAGMEVTAGQGEAVRAELLGKMSHFIHSPFLSVLLWFDRQITELPHAWLLGTTIQWFFHKSKIRAYPESVGSYVEVVIAGSRAELVRPRAELLALAREELGRFFPESRDARLVKSGILKEARATFTATPGLDLHRPEQAAGLNGLYLAGDWTKTDWPSTMEGAARSGRLAAGALLGDRLRFLAPDLPPSGLMRWLADSPTAQR